MKKIMIFYHSGAGSTKMIGEIFKEKLSEAFEVEIKRVEKNYDFESIKKYDFLIFGFPVYGFEASPSMQEFVDAILTSHEPKKCFIYSTLAFISGNSIRKLAKKLDEKNIITTGYAQFFSPASDGSLIFPVSWKWTSSFKKKTPDKIESAMSEISKEVNSPNFKLNIPRQKKIWDLIEKLFLKTVLKQEKEFINALRIGEERCTNCNKCVNVCERGCITKGDKYPQLNTENCEFCLGCVHHCPNKAITFLNEYIDKPRLSDNFFKIQKIKFLNK